MRARKDERLIALATQRRAHRERLAHIHRVAGRVTEHGVRTMHRPREATGGSFAKQHVFLRVVEVQPWKSRRVPMGSDRVLTTLFGFIGLLGKFTNREVRLLLSQLRRTNSYGRE
jgi:hypothetical protein